MATVNGCKALGLAAHHATLQAGAPARLYSVRFDPTDRRDPLTQVLENRYPVQPLKIAENML
jgi:cytosine/adenosine deaminase-related metal-dependent hydrolase